MSRGSIYVFCACTIVPLYEFLWRRSEKNLYLSYRFIGRWCRYLTCMTKVESHHYRSCTIPPNVVQSYIALCSFTVTRRTATAIFWTLHSVNRDLIPFERLRVAVCPPFFEWHRQCIFASFATSSEHQLARYLRCLPTYQLKFEL